MQQSVSRHGLFAATIALGLVIACSADQPDGAAMADLKGPAAADSNDGAGSGANLGPAVEGGHVAQPRPDTSGDQDADMPVPEPEELELDGDTACGKGKASAEFTPVNMLVMFDRSRSMLNNGKWPAAASALTAFFKNPAAEGLRIGLRFFPHDEPSAGCTKAGCNAPACAEPLVHLGDLSADSGPADAHEQALVDAVAGSAPPASFRRGDGTPMSAALDGALQWASGHKLAVPEETTVVVFVTDGEPNGCNEDFDSIAALAAAALETADVATYAIGLEGSSEAQMDQLAQAGGTGSGIFISDSANAEQELLAALNAIRGETLSCDFPMPNPTDDSTALDPQKINVTFTGQNAHTGTFPQVDDQGSCDDRNAWFYDDPQAPTRITLCPAACDTVRADPDAQVEILIGCATCGGLDMDCGSGGPGVPAEIPPLL